MRMAEGWWKGTTRISEASLTNYPSSESLVQTALKRLIMLGGVKREEDDDGQSRDSSTSSSSNSLMMSLDHSSDPNGSVIDGGASNFEAPTSLASSSTSNDQGRKSCSSPGQQEKEGQNYVHRTANL